MKFGKRLQSQIQETIPEWRDKFLSYKQLKKRLKLIAAPDCFTEAAFDASSSPSRGDGGVGICRLPSSAAAAAASAVDAVDQELRRGSEAGGPAAVQEAMLQEARAKKIKRTSTGGLDIEPKKQQQQLQSKRSGGLLENNESALMSSEMDFIRLLNNELNKFNVFFIEKEEEYVIRLQELKDRIETVKKEKAAMKGDPSESTGDDELLTILRDIVTFHGEMVLLENYSSLNYTGLVKILKKHDKRTGAVLRMPFIQSVLLQPFFTTELLSKLVRECERNLHSLLSSSLEEVLLSVQGSSTTPESSSPSAPPQGVTPAASSKPWPSSSSPASSRPRPSFSSSSSSRRHRSRSLVSSQGYVNSFFKKDSMQRELLGGSSGYASPRRLNPPGSRVVMRKLDNFLSGLQAGCNF